jgi:TolA-binding protein
MRRIRAIAAGIRAAGAIPPALAGTFPALVALLALLLLLPGAAPAQTEDLDPLTRLERDLAGLDEEGVYRKAEALRMGYAMPDLTIRAYEEIGRRFPQGPRAPKAAFELGMMGVRDGSNLGRALDTLKQAQEGYPESAEGRLAADYHAALTDPKTARHLELLADVFHRAHRVETGPNMVYSIAVNFITWEFAQRFKKGSFLEVLAADTGLTDQDKSLIAYDLANMLYRAPAREECKLACEWIVKQYPKEAEGSARALILLGNLRRVIASDFDGAEPYFRQLAEKYGDLDLAPATFLEWAGDYFGHGDPAKAKALLDEVRTKWPKSVWSLRTREILGQREMTSLFGEPPALTDEEKKWQAVRAWEKNPEAPLPDDLEEAHIARFCGPWSVWWVCEQLGAALSPAEAARKCASKGGGTSLGDLARAFEAAGLKVAAQEMGMEEMKALAAQPGKKVILHLPDHYMVVESVDDKGIVLSDSSNQSQRLSFERLAIYWDGYLLCVEK